MRQRRLVTLVIAACFCITISTGWLASAGDLEPPPGPINSTMITLDELAASIAGLGVKRVFRGTFVFGANNLAASVTINSSLDLSKSVVSVTNAVSAFSPCGGLDQQDGYVVYVDQMGNSGSNTIITFQRAFLGVGMCSAKGSYEIVEYN